MVVYSWNTQPELVAIARRKGARGYLSKALPADALVDALVRIHQGEVVISAQARGPEPHWESDTGPEGPDLWPGQGYGLSGRESEVLALIAQV